MSFNIVDLVKDQLSDQVMGSIGSALGVQNSQASSALSGALPGLLSGLTNSAGSSQGASALFDAVQKQDDGMLGNIGNLLGGSDATNIANQGSSLLGSLLGKGALGTLAGTVAKAAGIGGSSSSSLLGMLAPIVLGVLKKKIFDGGMNANSMASMLTEQKGNIQAAMPAGFSDQLQSGGFFDSISNATSGVAASASESVSNTAQNAQNAVHGSSTETTTEKTGGGLMKWLIPLIVIGVLAWLAMQLFGGKSVEDTATAAQETVSDAAGSAGALSEDAMQAARDAMPEGVNLDEINDGLSGAFGSATDALSGITDAESATAAIPALEEVTGNLGGLNDMISGLPDAAKGPIASIVGTGIETLQPLIEKVTAIPGVGDMIAPVIEPLMEMLQGMAG